MDISILLLLLGVSVLILPALLGDEDEDTDQSEEDGIKGTYGDDTLTGTPGADLIRGFSGNDTVEGNGGLDDLRGGSGNDTVTGGSGRDVIDGGSGEDRLFGLAGNDTIEGDADNDYIDGGYGSDVIRGGYGNDTILGGPGARLIDGELVNATERDDTLRGEAGDDTIYSWGGTGLVVGGQNPDGEADDVDTLVLVTGTAELGDAAGDTQFYALANLNDDQETLAIITEFDVEEHELILTVDAADSVDLTTTPDYQITFERTRIERDNGVFEDGILVSVVIDPLPAGTTADDFETASAFFRGNIFANPATDLSDVNISIAFTNQSDTQYLDDTNYEDVLNIFDAGGALDTAETVDDADKVALNFDPADGSLTVT
ncbi:MAG: calcium-binding protein [Yoonia sp.]|uniref:calcium-binding protein n=1 Tax=Yoonia sp. TaxID=2212373 RepID=UPI003EF763BB